MGVQRVVGISVASRSPRGAVTKSPSSGRWPPSPRGGRLRWVSIRNGDASPLSRETGCEQQRSLNRGGGAGVGEQRVVVISVAVRSPRGARNLEYGASAVFPCGQNPPSIQTTALPHNSTSPENTVRCPDWDQSVRPTNNRRGQVVPVRELAGSGNARLWPHGKTAEAPYSRFAQPRPIDSTDRRTTAGATSFLCGNSPVRGTPGCGRMGRRRKRRTPSSPNRGQSIRPTDEQPPRPGRSCAGSGRFGERPAVARRTASVSWLV